jgi:thioredoxin-like negative regulator of GroEL
VRLDIYQAIIAIVNFHFFHRPLSATTLLMTFTFQPKVLKCHPLLVAFAILFFSEAKAQPSPAPTATTAQQGLDMLLKQPWNHDLRFAVAENLAQEGRINEAITQLEALYGTKREQAAVERLRQLKTNNQPSRTQVQVQPMAQPQRQGEAAPLPVRALPSSRQVAVSTPAPVIGQENAPITLRQLPQFEYVAPGNALGPQPGSMSGIKSSLQGKELSPGTQEVLELMKSGNHQDAGTKGLALIAKEKVDDEVRVMVANSLAWTARLKEAATVYASVKTGAAAQDAEVGLANIEHWQGRDDLAASRYRKVLASDPEHAGASEGLALALRELRPRTIFNAGRSRDSADVQRDAGTLTQRWSSSDGSRRYEVEASAVRDRSPSAAEREQAVTLRYSAPTLSLKPSFELSVPNRSERTVYGGVRATVAETTIEVARVNWGKMALTPQALTAGLSANHIGAEWKRNVDIGSISARLAYYDISDNNTIWTSALQLTPSWRPLGTHFKPFVGMETREARFNTPQYWSPAIGFGTAYAGLMAEWGAAEWSLFGSAQAGTRLYGDAGTSWSISTGGKRWIGEDFGIGFALWSMASQRDNARYRASSANFTVEKIW